MDDKGSLQMANTAKTAIVTGASQGIGAGLVEAFLNRGYSVVANSRNITKANPFAAAENVALVEGDIGHPSTAAAIVDTAVSRFGQIDALINMERNSGAPGRRQQARTRVCAAGGGAPVVRVDFIVLRLVSLKASRGWYR
jgi:NAD(P)-dependent dehydrogenase (short-subunit alcohol dehydrogenase family)